MNIHDWKCMMIFSLVFSLDASRCSVSYQLVRGIGQLYVDALCNEYEIIKIVISKIFFGIKSK